jgi:hypothetical protein
MRTPFVLLFGLLILNLLSSCDRDREARNRRLQSGVWNLRRVGWTYYDSLGTVERAATETDCGQVCFVNHEGPAGENFPEVRFYFDKETPTRGVPTYAGGSLVERVAAGTFILLRWRPDAYERRRVLLTRDILDPTLIYTLTDDTGDRQRWELVTSDVRDRIRFREIWEIEREE